MQSRLEVSIKTQKICLYSVTGLIDLLKDRIRKRDEESRRRRAADARLVNAVTARPAKTVYRVIQCQDSELTNLVSTLSDGWEFVQLVSFHSVPSFVYFLIQKPI